MTALEFLDSAAVIIYALLAVLLWPSDRAGSPPSFVAGRPLGVTAARLLWLAMWGSLAYFAVQATNRTPEGLHDMISGMASGEPGWLARIDRAAATLLAHRGGQAAIVLAVALCVIAIGVFLPVPAARASLVLAVVVAAVSWVIGQDFGAIFTGRGTDPGSAPMLALLVAAYWPAGMAGRHPQPQWPPQPQEHSQRHLQPPGPHPHPHPHPHPRQA